MQMSRVPRWKMIDTKKALVRHDNKEYELELRWLPPLPAQDKWVAFTIVGQVGCGVWWGVLSDWDVEEQVTIDGKLVAVGRDV
jgi:hypothetical protein